MYVRCFFHLQLEFVLEAVGFFVGSMFTLSNTDRFSPEQDDDQNIVLITPTENSIPEIQKDSYGRHYFKAIGHMRTLRNLEVSESTLFICFWMEDLGPASQKERACFEFPVGSSQRTRHPDGSEIIDFTLVVPVSVQGYGRLHVYAVDEEGLALGCGLLLSFAWVHMYTWLRFAPTHTHTTQAPTSAYCKSLLLRHGLPSRTHTHSRGGS